MKVKFVRPLTQVHLGVKLIKMTELRNQLILFLAKCI